MAKTVCPTRPDGSAHDWPADDAFALVQPGWLVGHSVGSLALRLHPPSEEEIRNDPSLAGVRRDIDNWLLLEYARSWLPSTTKASSHPSPSPRHASRRRADARNGP